MRIPKPSNVRVRKATAADAEAILRCLGFAFDAYKSSYTAAGYEDTVLTKQSIGRRLKEMSVFVAVESAGEVIGTIACRVDGTEGHLRGMAVLPAWQGCGAAEELLIHAESALRSRGCKLITLDTTEPLQRAMRFYEKHGYRRSGKVGDFFGMPLIEYVKDVEGQKSRAL